MDSEINETQKIVNKIEYKWNAPLLPGTIICSTYGNWNDEKVVGIFCVLYDESLDGNIFDKDNILAVKVSSQNTLASNYSCKINTAFNQFMDKNCIVCCSKVHLLHKSKQVYKVLGQLDKHTYARVVKTYISYAHSVERQLLDRI